MKSPSVSWEGILTMQLQILNLSLPPTCMLSPSISWSLEKAKKSLIHSTSIY